MGGGIADRSVRNPAPGDNGPVGPEPEAASRLAAPRDGRQSERALAIRRGTGRLLARLGFAMVAEVTLASGRRADLVAIGPGGEIWIVEIKSSVEDMRADLKWPDYRSFCDRLFFATRPEVPPAVFPPGEGLILSDGYGAEIVREAPLDKLAAARRKAMTVRFAVPAARRLHLLEDPAVALHEAALL